MKKMKPSNTEWIGEIPESWSINRIKYVADFEPICDFTKLPPDSMITYTPMENIKNGYYIPNTAVLGSLSTSLTAYQDNDIVMAKVTPCFENGNIAVMSGLSSGVGLGSSELFVFRAKEIQTRYLFYWLQNQAFVEQAKATMTGTGGLKRVSPQFMRNCAIHCPPVDEQSRIADFLDTECARIDAVIEQTRASIEEYKKLKQAVITEAVTKGIRPGRKMKDSGIKWVGKMPEDWESINPKALFSQRKEKATAGERQLTASQQYGVIYQDEYMELTGSKVVTVEKDFDILKHVEEGDFVISMRSFQGGLEYSTKTGSISSAYVMLIPNLSMVFPRFYRWLLKSSVYINALQSTSNMVRDGQAMRYSNFAQVRLYSVPLDEQEEIADYLDEKCAAIDQLVKQKESFLTELETYKKSLIFEYVTGKKEVQA